MKVKIKKLSDLAIIPKYANITDAGLDLYSISKTNNDNYIEHRTGLAIEIPEGYVGLIFPRSSISEKDVMLANSVGVIDSGYRGEIKIRFKMVDHKPSVLKSLYNTGEKIAQLVIIPYPSIEFEEVEEISTSDRGEGGFGSTGKL